VNVPNIGGAFSTGLGKAFGTGDDIYVQWREYDSPELIANLLSTWHSSLKHINIHGVSSTCQSTEIAMVSENTTAGNAVRPSLYTNCGDGFNVNLPNGDILLQQSVSSTDGYNCLYQNQVAGTGNGVGCYFAGSGVWVTYYVHIHLGHQGQSDSTLDAYVSVAGGPYKQFQRVTAMPWGAGDSTYQIIRLETYMTEIGAAAKVDAFVWYDELIVSTQPIAPPTN
jgi:hypothetical protein